MQRKPLRVKLVLDKIGLMLEASFSLVRNPCCAVREMIRQFIVIMSLSDFDLIAS